LRCITHRCAKMFCIMFAGAVKGLLVLGCYASIGSVALATPGYSLRVPALPVGSTSAEVMGVAHTSSDVIVVGKLNYGANMSFGFVYSYASDSFTSLTNTLDARAISADGTTIVGETASKTAYYYLNGVLTDLGRASVTDTEAFASSVSADGSVIGGSSVGGVPVRKAFYWTQGSGVVAPNTPISSSTTDGIICGDGTKLLVWSADSALFYRISDGALTDVTPPYYTDPNYSSAGASIGPLGITACDVAGTRAYGSVSANYPGGVSSDEMAFELPDPNERYVTPYPPFDYPSIFHYNYYLAVSATASAIGGRVSSYNWGSQTQSPIAATVNNDYLAPLLSGGGVDTRNVGLNSTDAVSADGQWLAGASGSGIFIACLVPALSNVSVPASVAALVQSTGTVNMVGCGQPGGSVVTLSTDNQNLTLAPSVSVPFGTPQAQFHFTPPVVASPTVIHIYASFGSQQVQTQFTAIPGVSIAGIRFSPSSTVAGGNSLTAIVNLSKAAPTGGTVVTLTSSNSAAVVPASVTVLAGHSGVSFPITTSGVDANIGATITASATNAGSATAILTLTPPTALSKITYSPGNVVGGNWASVNAYLAGKAGPSGLSVQVQTTSPYLVAVRDDQGTRSLPTTVKFSAGSSFKAFTVQTSPVDSFQPSPLALLNSSMTINVTAADPQSLKLSSASVLGGTPASATLVLNGLAGPNGRTYAVSSSVPSVVPPATVTVPSGKSSVSFSVNTSGVDTSTNAVIGISNVGQQGLWATSTLTVLPASAISRLTARPTPLVGGNSISCTVFLNAKIGSSDKVVSLSSDSASLMAPASVPVPANASYVTFIAKTSGVDAQKVANLSASFGSGPPVSTPITLMPASILSVTVTPGSVTGGETSTAIVRLDGQAGPSGITLSLLSTNPAATVPSLKIIGPELTASSFTVNTKAVASATSGGIWAISGTIARFATLIVNP
jgi:hypothetical protein